MAEQIIDWSEEANAVIRDVKSHVKRIEISEKLISDGSNIFINLETKENKFLTILLDQFGFQIVSYNCFDSCDAEEDSVEVRLNQQNN